MSVEVVAVGQDIEVGEAATGGVAERVVEGVERRDRVALAATALIVELDGLSTMWSRLPMTLNTTFAVCVIAAVSVVSVAV